MVPVSNVRGSVDSYINAVLAVLTSLLMLLALALDVIEFVRGPEAPPAFPPGGIAGIVVGFVAPVFVIAVFWFWGRMLHDYFKNRPAKCSAAWGWALLLLNVCASIVYYWYVWRPRNAPHSGSAA